MPKSTHPAETLSRSVDEDARRTLLGTPPALLIENAAYKPTVALLRGNSQFCYLAHWLYLLRQLIHFKDEFDVENLEEEIVGIAEPPVLLGTLKSKLVQYLANYKMRSVDREFAEQAKQILGDDADYDAADLQGKISVLYRLAVRANRKSFDLFRKAVDKMDEDDSRVDPVYETQKGNCREEWFMLADARLYYRKWQFVPMDVPKNRAQYLVELDDEPEYIHYQEIEPQVVEWKCLTCGIYEFDAFVQDLKAKAGRKKRCFEYRLASRLEPLYDLVVDHDLRKRRQAQQRKKEVKMQYLLAHRKRSSRLMEKEQHKKEEEARQKEEEQQEALHAADLRAERRRRIRERQLNMGSANERSRSNTRSVSPKASRAERYKRRKTAEPENWQFDCLCGIKKKNYDDGTQMISCDRCSRWQHTDCQPEEIKKLIENDPKYKFVCSYCRGESVVGEPQVVEASNDADAVQVVENENKANESKEAKEQTNVSAREKTQQSQSSANGYTNEYTVPVQTGYSVPPVQQGYPLPPIQALPQGLPPQGFAQPQGFPQQGFPQGMPEMQPLVQPAYPGQPAYPVPQVPQVQQALQVQQPQPGQPTQTPQQQPQPGLYPYYQNVM